MPEPLFTIPGVEIFRAGTWNGDTYTPADLDEMVANFAKVGYRPPLKAGHVASTADPTPDPEGAPALGWVANLRRVGEVLLADFVDLPRVVYDAIARRAYDTVSTEVYLNLKRGGATFSRALKAVALLGAQIPAVNLRPISAVLTEAPGDSRAYPVTLVFTQPAHKESPMSDDTKPDATSEKIRALETLVKDLTIERDAAKAKAGEVATFDERLTQLRTELATERETTRQLAEGQRQRDITATATAVTVPAFRPYIRALADAITAKATTVKFTADSTKTERETPAREVLDGLVAELNAKAARLFGEASHAHSDAPGRARAYADVDGEIDRLVGEYQAKTPNTSYALALQAVLAMPAHADLKAAYAAVRR